MRLDGDLPVVGASAIGPGLVAPPRGGETRWSVLPPPVGVRLPVGVFLVLKVWKAAVGKSQDREGMHTSSTALALCMPRWVRVANRVGLGHTGAN